MLKRYFSLALIIVLLHTCAGAPAFAQVKAVGGGGDGGDAAAAAEKIRRKVLTRGTGVKARVSVKLNDGTKLKGYVSESAADDFTLVRTDAQTGTAVKINYGDVAELKGHGKGMSTTSKVLLGAGVGVGVTVGVLVLLFRNVKLGPW